MGRGPIVNARDYDLTQATGNLPNVSEAMTNWFQPMIFNLITKETVNFLNKETSNLITFQGVWQPYTAQQLLILPEGQRAWKWFMLHAEISLILEPDQIVEYESVRYRVMLKKDYQKYGYIEYSLIEDYQEIP